MKQLGRILNIVGALFLWIASLIKGVQLCFFRPDPQWLYSYLLRLLLFSTANLKKSWTLIVYTNDLTTTIKPMRKS